MLAKTIGSRRKTICCQLLALYLFTLHCYHERAKCYWKIHRDRSVYNAETKISCLKCARTINKPNGKFALSSPVSNVGLVNTSTANLLVKEYDIRCPDVFGMDAKIVIDAAELTGLPPQLEVFPELHVHRHPTYSEATCRARCRTFFSIMQYVLSDGYSSKGHRWATKCVMVIGYAVGLYA